MTGSAAVARDVAGGGGTVVQRARLPPPVAPAAPQRTPALHAAHDSGGTFVIAALVEGRGHARGEVGLAYLDLTRLELHLAAFADTPAYARTLAKLHVHPPAELLFPATAYTATQASKLYATLSANLDESTAFVTLSRKHFNEARGLEDLQALCVVEYATVLMDVQTRWGLVFF